MTIHAIERMNLFKLNYRKAKQLIKDAIPWEASRHSKNDNSVTLKNGPFIFVMNKSKKILITVFDQRLDLPEYMLGVGR